MKSIYKVLFLMAAAMTISSAQNFNCAVTADATMLVGKTPQGNYFDSRSSGGITYSTDCNPSYTVDINLPGDYSINVGNAIIIGGGFDQPSQLTESTCAIASVTMLIYKRSYSRLTSWSNWQLVNQQVTHGTWIPFVDIGLQPYCSLTVPLRVVAAGGYSLDQYRVMVQPKLFGSPTAAKVFWEWTY